jgi:MraZ protein
VVQHAGISREIVISSAVNILEVWDKKRYEDAISEATVDFGALAEEVMGDKDDED